MARFGDQGLGVRARARKTPKNREREKSLWKLGNAKNTFFYFYKKYVKLAQKGEDFCPASPEKKLHKTAKTAKSHRKIYLLRDPHVLTKSGFRVSGRKLPKTACMQ